MRNPINNRTYLARPIEIGHLFLTTLPIVARGRNRIKITKNVQINGEYHMEFTYGEFYIAATYIARKDINHGR